MSPKIAIPVQAHAQVCVQAWVLRHGDGVMVDPLTLYPLSGDTGDCPPNVPLTGGGAEVGVGGAVAIDEKHAAGENGGSDEISPPFQFGNRETLHGCEV